MSAFKRAAKTTAAALKKFFVETFRRHTKREYCEVLTRGLKRGEGKNEQYPWVYIRAFSLLFILFAAYVLTVRVTENELFIPAITLFGGLTFTLPITLLLYECYPEKDFSLVSMMAVIVLGGTFSCFLCQCFSYVMPQASGWLDSFRTGGLEEISKAIITLLIIVILGARNPYLGFLIGAGVGAGFSVVEDMGYLFLYSSDWLSSDLSAIVELFLSRGFTSFFTHIIWTGLIGWAYAKFDRHVGNVGFYGAVALSIALHSLWDNPLSGAWQTLIIIVCAAVALFIGVAIVSSWRKIALGVGVQTEMELPAEVKRVKNGSFFRHGARISFTAYGMLMAVCALVYCALPVSTGYIAETYTDKAEFISFVQNGCELSADWSREYDASAENYEEHYVSGELTQVVQAVNEGGYTYYYYYSPALSGYNLVQVMADVQLESGSVMRYTCTNIYYGGEIYVSFFAINENVTGCTLDEDGSITVYLYDESAKTESFPAEYAPVGYVALALTCAEVVIYSAFAVKASRVDKIQKSEEE